MSLRMGVLALPFLLVAFALVANNTQAAIRPANDADCQILRQHGVTCVVGVTPYNPNDAGVGQTADQAKRELKALPREPVNRSQCAAPTDDRNIDRLNDAFAICAAQFLKDYTNRYGRNSIVIRSAFRDGARGSGPDGRQSANQCAGGAGASNHTRGTAMDVQAVPQDTYQRLWRHASDNPQFGVCFPFQDRPLPGYPNGDRPHIILAGIGGSEGALCDQQGVTRACSGAPPTNIVARPPPPGPPLGLGNTARTSLLGTGFGLVSQPPPYTQPILPPQPFMQQQPLLGAFNNPAPLPQPTQQGVSSQITNTNTNSNTNQSTSTSVADRLLELAFGTSSSPTSSTGLATSAPIIISGANAGVITGSQQNTTTQAWTTGGIQSVGQQTFVSNDLRSQPQQNGFAATSDTRFQQTLATLKTALTMLLAYLTPFNTNVKLRQPVDFSGDGVQ